MICPRCTLEQPPSAFPIDRRRPSGRGSTCRACVNIVKRAARAANPTKHRGQARAARLRTLEAKRLRDRLHYAANRLQIRTRKNRHRAAHLTQARQQGRAKYARRKTQILAYARRTRHMNLGTEQTRIQRRLAQKRGLPHTFMPTDRLFMLQYWHYACALCGNQEGFTWTLALDHFIPLSSPRCPGTVATNIIPLCHGEGGCNNMKGSKEPQAWLRERYGARKAARILTAIQTYCAVVRARATQEDAATNIA
jgi:hypothetical protein